MIRITVADNMYIYDLFHITKAFFPDEDIQQREEADSTYPVCVTFDDDPMRTLHITKEELSLPEDRKHRKMYVSLKVYDWFRSLTGRELAWGILTGVRPTKLMTSLLEAGCSDQEAIECMVRERRLTCAKAKLGLDVAKKEMELLSKLDYENGYSLYVGIPFCPTTCSYCSFTSYPIALWEARVEDYLKALFQEISFVAKVSKEKKLNTVYIGGGTPTTLSANQMDRLLTHLEDSFSYNDLIEFTVEAGRPDSITEEKLMVLRKHGISRISINPQTMQQKTLDTIGRKHTVEDVYHVFAMARSLGFDNINMDLIVGLPGEDLEDVKDTLEQIQRLQPDSLTVHALAMKRASKLSQEKVSFARDGEMLSQMIELAANYADKMELQPYYLYRQKNIAGNFENVGYAKVDKAGVYNILIMEEKQSIVAVGAGSTTKIVLPEGKEIIEEKTGNVRKIARTENVKDVEQYISRIHEMIERKGEWLWR